MVLESSTVVFVYLLRVIVGMGFGVAWVVCGPYWCFCEMRLVLSL